jgi:hypothetical protein
MSELDSFKIDDTQQKLLDLHNSLNTINTKLMEDHQEAVICPGFTE